MWNSNKSDNNLTADDGVVIRERGTNDAQPPRAQSAYMTVAEIKPVVNEVESHPFLNQKNLQAHCESRGIKLIAYSPLGGTPKTGEGSSPLQDQNVRNLLLNNDLVKKLAEKYGKSSAQILIKYHPARGLIVIPKSVTKERIEQNADIFDFELTQQETDQLNALHNGTRYLHFKNSPIVNHKNFPFHDEY